MTEQVVDRREVEVHLARELGLEWYRFQVDYHERPEFEVVKEEIDVEIAATDLQVHLAADEGKADTEFQEELADVIQESTFELPLTCIVGKREKVKIVGVLQDLMGKVGLGQRQGAFKVGQGLSLPVVVLQQKGYCILLEPMLA